VSVDREAVRGLLAGRREPSSETAHGAERVEIALRGSGNGPFVCRKRDFEWVIDEPAERGGLDTGANPLAHFLSGSATCLLSHWLLLAIEDDIAFEDLTMRARMRFDRRLPGGRVTEMIYDVRFASTASREALERLARRAQDACYAHNTLAAAGVKLTTNIEANGEPLATLVV
jgi:uncharacterized OsmC-like protein